MPELSSIDGGISYFPSHFIEKEKIIDGQKAMAKPCEDESEIDI
jgi:hypothetical protein